jgi:hypothetical protein
MWSGLGGGGGAYRTGEKIEFPSRKALTRRFSLGILSPPCHHKWQGKTANS